MTTVEEIGQAVRGLSEDELDTFRRWFLAFDAKAWDHQLEADVADGRLDGLADEALTDLREGRTRPL